AAGPLTSDLLASLASSPGVRSPAIPHREATPVPSDRSPRVAPLTAGPSRAWGVLLSQATPSSAIWPPAVPAGRVAVVAPVLAEAVWRPRAATSRSPEVRLWATRPAPATAATAARTATRA